MKKTGILWSAALLAAILAFPALQISFAQQPTPSDNDVNAVAEEMYCPVCENTPLDVCPTTACAQWRELIREKLAEGWTDQQIKDYFVLQYGDRVLAEPPRQGLNWLIYIIPPVMILAGGILVYTILKKMHKPVLETQVESPSASNSPQPSDVDPNYLNRLEDELRKRNT